MDYAVFSYYPPERQVNPQLGILLRSGKGALDINWMVLIYRITGTRMLKGVNTDKQ